MKKIFCLFISLFTILVIKAQPKPGKKKETQPVVTVSTGTEIDSSLSNLKWRNIGPFRGGRSVAAPGVREIRLYIIWVLPVVEYGKHLTPGTHADFNALCRSMNIKKITIPELSK